MRDSRIRSVKTFMLSTLETDINGTMKPGALCNRMQEIAWQDASLNGFGYDELKEQGLMWMLSRFHIEIDKLPQWRDTVHLSTWPKKTDSLYAIRDFTLEDGQNQPLCRVTSSWVVIDLNSRRVKRPDVLETFSDSLIGISAINESSPKIRKPDNAEFMKKFRADLCDLDIIGHLNNTRYADWIHSSFPIEISKEKQLKSFKLNFLSEVLLNNEVEVYGVQENGVWIIEGRNISKDNISFRAEVEWV